MDESKRKKKKSPLTRLNQHELSSSSSPSSSSTSSKPSNCEEGDVLSDATLLSSSSTPPMAVSVPVAVSVPEVVSVVSASSEDKSSLENVCTSTSTQSVAVASPGEAATPSSPSSSVNKQDSFQSELSKPMETKSSEESPIIGTSLAITGQIELSSLKNELDLLFNEIENIETKPIVSELSKNQLIKTYNVQQNDKLDKILKMLKCINVNPVQNITPTTLTISPPPTSITNKKFKLNDEILLIIKLLTLTSNKRDQYLRELAIKRNLFTTIVNNKPTIELINPQILNYLNTHKQCSVGDFCSINQDNKQTGNKLLNNPLRNNANCLIIDLLCLSNSERGAHLLKHAEYHLTLIRYCDNNFIVNPFLIKIEHPLNLTQFIQKVELFNQQTVESGNPGGGGGGGECKVKKITTTNTTKTLPTTTKSSPAIQKTTINMKHHQHHHRNDEITLEYEQKQQESRIKFLHNIELIKKAGDNPINLNEPLRLNGEKLMLLDLLSLNNDTDRENYILELAIKNNLLIKNPNKMDLNIHPKLLNFHNINLINLNGCLDKFHKNERHDINNDDENDNDNDLDDDDRRIKIQQPSASSSKPISNKINKQTLGSTSATAAVDATASENNNNNNDDDDIVIEQVTQILPNSIENKKCQSELTDNMIADQLKLQIKEATNQVIDKLNARLREMNATMDSKQIHEETAKLSTSTTQLDPPPTQESLSTKKRQRKRKDRKTCLATQTTSISFPSTAHHIRTESESSDTLNKYNHHKHQQQQQQQTAPLTNINNEKTIISQLELLNSQVDNFCSTPQTLFQLRNPRETKEFISIVDLTIQKIYKKLKQKQRILRHHDFANPFVKPIIKPAMNQQQQQQQTINLKSYQHDVNRLYIDVVGNYEIMMKPLKPITKTNTTKSNEDNNIHQNMYDLEENIQIIQKYVDKLVAASLGDVIETDIRINPYNVNRAYCSNSKQPDKDPLIRSILLRQCTMQSDRVRLFVYHKIPDQQRSPLAFVIRCIEHRTNNILGHLILNKNKNYMSAVPTNKYCPKIRIYKKSALLQHVGGTEGGNGASGGSGAGGDGQSEIKINDQSLYLIEIYNWEQDLPIGRILREIGDRHILNTCNEAILLQNKLEVPVFSQTIINDLPSDEFQIPTEEYNVRENLTKNCIFTIDPATARDLDDAMSCKLLPNGNYEIGVHISDVTYFIPELCELDEQIKDQATSIYLVDQVYHMLPRSLCMTCSLLPGQDKLAFSVVWEITPDCQIISTRFSKTIINSCVQLAYSHAQQIIQQQQEQQKNDNENSSSNNSSGSGSSTIDNNHQNNDDNDDLNFPPILNGFNINDITNTILQLNHIAVQLRKKRFDNLCIKIDQPKISFNLDPITGEPLSFQRYRLMDANFLIEEFMLLANQSVAAHIFKHYPNISILRNHSAPKQQSLETLATKLKQFHFELDLRSAHSISKSFANLVNNWAKTEQQLCVINDWIAKPMNRAEYFCSELVKHRDDYLWHFALSIPIYTHFTSPIRRYPDIMVHRLLAASLKLIEVPKRTPDELQAIAVRCNEQKYNAKLAGEESSHLYFMHFILSTKNRFEMRSVVTDIILNCDCIEVMLIENGLKIKIFFRENDPPFYMDIEKTEPVIGVINFGKKSRKSIKSSTNIISSNDDNNTKSIKQNKQSIETDIVVMDVDDVTTLTAVNETVMSVEEIVDTATGAAAAASSSSAAPSPGVNISTTTTTTTTTWEPIKVGIFTELKVAVFVTDNKIKAHILPASKSTTIF